MEASDGSGFLPPSYSACPICCSVCPGPTSYSVPYILLPFSASPSSCCACPIHRCLACRYLLRHIRY
eukprot:2039702-Rhodomonas_salina.1